MHNEAHISSDTVMDDGASADMDVCRTFPRTIYKPSDSGKNFDGFVKIHIA